MPVRPTPLDADGLVTVSEPHEGAFTVLMPAGWANRAELQREHALNRVIASAVSPDRETTIHLGDPRVPLFVAPGLGIDPFVMQFNPHMRMQPYTPAEPFFRDYVLQCFGGAPGFRLTDVAPAPEFLRQSVTPDLARRLTAATAVAVTFEHRGLGPTMFCRLLGSTLGAGSMWSADLVTVSTTGDRERYTALALRMVTSRHFHPGWAAAQQRLHEQRMAAGAQQTQAINAWGEVMRQGHEQRMRDIQHFGQVNTQLHNERMAQTDSIHRAWMAEQARGDEAQRARVNAIREEHTVADASGATYQVSAHHARYFVNKRDNTYIGADAGTELRDLRRTHGVNPDDYEEVKVVR